MCGGTRLFKSRGYHDPMNPYKWKSCLYCDENGHNLIEAAESTILEYFKQLEPDARERLLKAIADATDM